MLFDGYNSVEEDLWTPDSYYQVWVGRNYQINAGERFC